MCNGFEASIQLISKRVISNQKYDHHENLKDMNTTEKQFDAVNFMRQQREKLTQKLSKMTKAEMLEYFKNRKAASTIKPCA